MQSLKVLFILFFFFINEASASDTDFFNINNLHGISIREVNSICKDETGFIWASSKTGILRLTDDDYRIYQLPYQTADVISVNLTYRNQMLIAYTNNGQIFKYNAIYDRFDLLINMNVVLNSRYLTLNRLLIDWNDNFWISSSMGLYKYENETIVSVSKDNSTVNYIEWYNDSILYKARENQIFRFDTHTLESEIVQADYTFLNSAVGSMHFDEYSAKLWIGTLSSGVFYYDINVDSVFNYLPKEIPRQPILTIESISDSIIMIGVDGQGIWELSKHHEQIIDIYKESSDNPSSLRGNGVYDILYDGAGRVWVCTYSGGVSFFNRATPLVGQIKHVINNPNSLVNNDVNSVLEDSYGNIWFATNNGLSQWKRESNKWTTFFHNTQAQAQVFLSLCEDNHGRIWAGTYSSGFYVIDQAEEKVLKNFPSTRDSRINNNFVFDIFKDSNGDIWIGGVNENLICYIVEENRFHTYAPYPLYVINELDKETMLLGCTYGLLSLDKNTGQTSTLVSGYLVNDILVLDKYVWIGTVGDGLLQYNTLNGAVKKFTSQNGLPSNFVKGVTYADGYLWVGTENGLCRFNPDTYATQTYESQLALSTVSYNQSSHYVLKSGDLIWGTNNGAVLFNPSSIEQIEPEGRIFIQDLIVAGRSVRENSDIKLKTTLDDLQSIELNYTHNTLTVEYLPLGVSTSGVKYSWMLEGHDTYWSQATSNRSFTYANIPYGDFILRIRMHDPSMLHVVDEKLLQISILPPFWQTWWFNSLILFLVISSTFLVLVYYVNQLKKRHSEDKIRFFASTAHDLRTALTLISAPVQELEKEKAISTQGRYYLNLAAEQTKRLLKVSTQLLDFQKTDTGKESLHLTMTDIVKLVEQRSIMFESLASLKSIQLKFNCNVESYITAIDESMIEKVVDNIISNAIKYSHENASVQVNLQCNKPNWIFEVLDEGIGIDKNAQNSLFNEFYRGENAINSKIVGSGIGLLLSKNYIALHEGKITCESIEDKGSCFRVNIPYKQVRSESENKFEPTELGKPATFQAYPLKQTSKRNMRVLLAEDNDDLRIFMQTALQNDFDIVSAEDGKVAWEKIRKELPDLIVSDIMMPHVSGYELCEKMKSTYETSHIPIILLTALSEKSEHMHGLGLGADDYLTKPFDVALLVQKIKTIVRNREKLREKALLLLKPDSCEPVFENKLNDEFVRKAVETVKKNLSNQVFGKDNFASEMNVSSSLLYKKIKALTDQSPTDFIKTIRLNSAHDYLKSGKYSVTEVSELCGFSSVSYFSSVFKKHFGKSPKAAL